MSWFFIVFSMLACDDNKPLLPPIKSADTNTARDQQTQNDPPIGLQDDHQAGHIGSEMDAGIEVGMGDLGGIEIGGMTVNAGIAMTGGTPANPSAGTDQEVHLGGSPVGGASGTTEGYIRYLHVSTGLSPSWVAWSEIQILGRPMGSNDAIRNLARTATATASRSADSTPNMAIDGDEGSNWNAGDFPHQWIEIDLQQPCEIEQIRLRVSQSPAGETMHVLNLHDENHELIATHVLRGVTQAQQWLEYRPELTYSNPDAIEPPDVSGLSRGLAWVRTNPMFISGLAVSVPQPSAEQVREYFDEFHANAVHLWSNGLPNQISNWNDAGHPEFRWVSWVSKDGTSVDGGQLLGGAQRLPGRIGYQIGDEPGLNMDGMEELMEIEQGMNAVRAVDPNALLIVNFSWWAEELDEMMEYYGESMDGDVVSYDLYSLRQSTYKRLEYFRAVGLRYGLPYWRYIFSYQDVGADQWPSRTDLRWDAFLGLVYGYHRRRLTKNIPKDILEYRRSQYSESLRINIAH